MYYKEYFAFRGGPHSFLDANRYGRKECAIRSSLLPISNFNTGK